MTHKMQSPSTATPPQFPDDGLSFFGSGKAGVLDVADVHQATVRALQVHASLLDADCVFLYGGSHGGLLGAHLVGQQRDFYRAAALRNPVIDLNSMADGSDSPDWVVIQAGLGDGVRLEDGLSTPKTLAAKWRHSPIRYVHLVGECSPYFRNKKETTESTRTLIQAIR